MNTLREKQKRFADEYIRCGNANEAARIADYKQPHVQGARLLANVSVKAYIDKQLAKMDAKRVMSATEAMQLLTSIARGEIEETIYIPTQDGVAEIKKKSDINQRKSALDSLLKRYPKNEDLDRQLTQARIDKIEHDIKTSEKGSASGVTIIVNNDLED